MGDLLLLASGGMSSLLKQIESKFLFIYLCYNMEKGRSYVWALVFERALK